MHKIGVIISIYNTEKYLRDCVDSILKQKWTDYRVVLVDDGSTDKSGYICDLYDKKDSRITVIHQNNMGVIAAAVKAIEELNDCEYITFVDSDDWLDDSAFKDAEQYLGKYDVVSYNIIRFYSETNKIYTKEYYETGLYDREGIEKHIYPTMIWDIKNEKYGLDPSLCNKFVKRELLHKYILRASHLRADYGQDVAIIYPMMTEADSIFFMEGYYYYHRQRLEGDIPLYMSDEAFIEKTYDLYKYIRSYFADNNEIKKQIDFFFVQALELRLFYLYKKRTIRSTFVFPFEKVRKGSKIILFGGGDVGKSYYDQLFKTKYCEIIAWVDSNNPPSYRGFCFSKPETISQYKYDKIVICTVIKEYKAEIKNKLLELGVSNDKIIG